MNLDNVSPVLAGGAARRTRNLTTASELAVELSRCGVVLEAVEERGIERELFLPLTGLNAMVL
jgi:hypothetical protein